MEHNIGRIFEGIEGDSSMDRRRFLGGSFALAASVAALAIPNEAAGAQSIKATWVNQYTYVAPDLAETRDWYQEVFGMQIGYRDAESAHLWYGDEGGDTLMILRQARSEEAAPRLENFAFTVDPWDRETVEAELTRRGSRPTPDGELGFWFDDPDGNRIGLFSKEFLGRPSGSAEAPRLWRALSANHIVVTSEDYRALGDWYGDLLSLRETRDSGRDVYQWFADSVWIPTAVGEGGRTSPELRSLDHVAYTIADYDDAVVYAELTRRGLKPTVSGGGGVSYNCVDINDFKTQVCHIDLVRQAERRTPG